MMSQDEKNKHADFYPKRLILQDLEPALSFFQKYRDYIVAVEEVQCIRKVFRPLDFSHILLQHLTVFNKQLQIYKKLDLPVNIHSQSAAKVTIATLKEQCGCIKIRIVPLMLCCTTAGKPSVAMEEVQAGYFFSFSPAVSRAKLIKLIPLEHICLETDSLVLGPKKRGNEPKNILLVCEYIAQVKGITPQMVIHATTENALRLFLEIKSLGSHTSH
uniref:TatD DNase domain containing 3 n=1 Tax=Hucho hucho TaxID=62062 RepID=A0A4W5P8D0_9TELE